MSCAFVGAAAAGGARSAGGFLKCLGNLGRGGVGGVEWGGVRLFWKLSKAFGSLGRSWKVLKGVGRS